MTTLANVCCASIPVESLSALGKLRTRATLRVIRVGGRFWLHWPGDEEVALQVLALPGVRTFIQHDRLWYALGSRVPTSEVPELGEGSALANVLLPASFQPHKPDEAPIEPVILRLERDDYPRPASAMRCSLRALADWADSATSLEMNSLQGVRCGERALVMGKKLPLLSGCQRYWGERVLVPLGYRPRPHLPESALVEALRLHLGELALVDRQGIEVVQRELLAPLSRAGVRLALREAP